ncbi:neutral/alkaline non-lysosomal ceramidase N-terminal domain-containing protein [Fulvivirga ligni]|uniref:neutral/alkaline non-lysosomal ceramidase N-terminal domain-containing protein n=1 Tax=Fulvivirga ligni TaxID=2904246 RepID=UPI001F17EEBB|nr:neutral/alkaline non-lysosomal ceramidase N-terminal domain-containing protein [Fulvivirga ligni]UII22292.1 neutral/alkaline non-lysosomal ceramidase N-terminal domain-containing protein [Fulvivirga ligni]
MRIGKKLSFRIFIFLCVIAAIISNLIQRIDRTALDKLPAYHQMLSELDTLDLSVNDENGTLQAGWGKANITPESATSLAGYGRRGTYQEVHDSLYSRAIVLKNSEAKIALISLDLMLFPPTVKKKLFPEMAKLGFKPNNIVLSATHTHNGYGSWNPSFGGQIILGGYNEELVDELVSQILQSVQNAEINLEPATLGYFQVEAGKYLENRLDKENGIVDPWIRNLAIKKQNGEIGLYTTYAAHATSIRQQIHALSRDYPGALVDRLENNDSIDFAMFAAGNVGSHRLAGIKEEDFPRIDTTAAILKQLIIKGLETVKYSSQSELLGKRVTLPLPPAQMRISEDYGVSTWVFEMAMGDLKGDISIAIIGDNMIVGMPCDFSGEIFQNAHLADLAQAKGKHLITTSFNGEYIGYITEDHYYDEVEKEEVRAMNWVGPHMGRYFSEATAKIIERL